MSAHIDDISHAQFCARCHRWGPEEATFCGHCGVQLRPIPFPPAPLVDAAHVVRRRRRRRLAAQLYGGTGLFGVLIGERLFHHHESRDADTRGGGR